MTPSFLFIRRKRPPLTRTWRTTFCASTSDKQKSNGDSIWKTNRGRDTRLARFRWLGEYRSFISASIIHKRPAGSLATGPNQPDPDRARRALGRMQTVRDKVHDPIPGAAAACPYQRRYTTAYNEAKNFGGDGITTPTQRTPEQTFIGTFWAYDGTPSLCAPPRLYNQITVHIADQTKLRPIELARLLALVNVSMADAAMSIWESKYHYDFWRPITGIRESDPGTGPTGAGDGNDATVGDPTFTPLGAPASNLNGPNFTPPFPAYPSGHAGFGGAIFETLRRFYGTDNIGFTFVSDEFNGVTKDHDGNVRPYMPRSFSTLSQAEEENGQSRIYLGIHWHFDKTAGIAQGRRVADYVFNHAFRPIQNTQ